MKNKEFYSRRNTKNVIFGNEDSKSLTTSKVKSQELQSESPEFLRLILFIIIISIVGYLYYYIVFLGYGRMYIGKMVLSCFGN